MNNKRLLELAGITEASLANTPDINAEIEQFMEYAAKQWEADTWMDAVEDLLSLVPPNVAQRWIADQNIL